MTQLGRKALLFITLLFFASLSMAEVAVPPLKARVTDLTGTLSANQIAQLEQKLASFESKKGSQIAVLIVPTTQPETIEQYSIRVVDEWKLGRKGVDDGILLLIAKQDRTLRIEVGYGLEGVLPDAVAKRITDEIIVPKLRQGDFAGGIAAGIERIARVIEGEPLPAPQGQWGKGEGTTATADILVNNLIFVFILLIILARFLQSMFGRFMGATLMSASAGFLVWLVFSSILIAVVAAFFAFFVSLLGHSGGSAYRGGRRGWPGGFGGMGGRGGFGNGGFGGGGFSGGGGGFGGGGASGRW
jgi:uncharacterized protein